MRNKFPPSIFFARAMIIALLLIAMGAGIGVYYVNNYGYYKKVSVENLIIARSDAPPLSLAVESSQAIDSASSPLRFRACLRLSQSALTRLLSQNYVAIDKPEPRVAPKILSCFDAKSVGEALEAKQANAFLSQSNIQPGIDRVGAVFSDGRVYMWHRLNPESKF